MKGRFSHYLDRFLSFLALGFGAGLIRPAPGSWGSLLAVFIALPIAFQAGNQAREALWLASLVTFLIGIVAAESYNRRTKSHDASDIVIDEMAGQFLVLSILPPTPLHWLSGFLLFRLMDIVKPFPVNLLDRKIKGGFGVMIDDIGAALYAMGAILLFQHFFPTLLPT